MGCSSSKDDVTVLPNKPTSQAWTAERNAENLNSKPASASSRKSKSGRSKMLRINSKENVEILAEDDQIKTDRSASQYSLRSEDGNGKRGTSATSKVSTRTFDSGLEEDFLPNMITEDSDPAKQKIAGDRPATPELGVVGTQIQSRQSSSKSVRNQKTSDDILNGLRSEGLLAAFGQKQSGMSFEVMIAPEFGILKKPPARLASLKKKKKKSKELTKEELEAKMQAAEERRKRKEAKMIAKLNTSAKELKAHQVANVNERTQQEQVKVKVEKTLDKVAANREAHFKALKEKMEQKKKHAEKVRLAKLERLADSITADVQQEEEQASAV
ncbi:uncharacterized protein [Amphiura filiformis]|uniref:uncharacterized protein n=1 Tax=Amphiura filiformis TaxID=82378 RepID=UPI003B215E19